MAKFCCLIHRSAWNMEFSEVRERLCDGELDGRTGAFYELLQIPHNPLRPLTVHRVAGIRVHLQPRIGIAPDAPLLFLARKIASRSPHKISVGASISSSRAVSSTVSTTPSM